MVVFAMSPEVGNRLLLSSVHLERAFIMSRRKSLWSVPSSSMNQEGSPRFAHISTSSNGPVYLEEYSHKRMESFLREYGWFLFAYR